MKNLSLRYSVGHILKIFPTLLFSFLIFQPLHLSAQETYKIPDFAFPKNVETNAYKGLDEALKSGDNLCALRNAMNLIIARNQLTDEESVVNNIYLLDSIMPQFTGIYYRLGNLLEASLLNEEYCQNRGKFDARKISLDGEFPADPLEWSGEMFKHRILSLLNSATKDLEVTPVVNITEISPLLSNCETAQKINLTANEFIAFKSALILQNLSGSYTATLIPFYPQETQISIEGQCRLMSRELFSSVVNVMAKQNSVVKALAMMEMMTDIPDYEQEKYLKNSLESLKGSEGESVILQLLWQRATEDKFKYYDDIRNYLERYPKGYGAEGLEYALGEMTKKSIQCDFPKVSLTKTSIPGNFTISNLKTGYLLVYKLSVSEADNYDNLIIKKFNTSAKPIQIIELKGSDKVPCTENGEIEISPLSAGLYCVIPSSSKKLPKDFKLTTANPNYSTIRVSDIAILSYNNSQEKGVGRVYVVNGKNQEPVAGATVTYFSGNSIKPKGSYLTNKEGFVNIPDNGYFRIQATFNGNIAKTQSGFGYYPEDIKNTCRASILTDLELYRPGDTISYSVVGWQQDKVNNILIRDKRIAISLRDPNYVQIDCDTIRLNDEGRATGKLIIPKGRLLGDYQLVATYPDYPNQVGGTILIHVEEYKLPSFFVTISQNKSPEEEELKFDGVAKTYSGMPVTNANVRVKIEYQPWRWWSHAPNASYSFECLTDSYGKFQFILPTGNLKGTIFDSGRYSISAEVSSQTGDTQKSSPLFFYLGEGSEIRPAIPDRIQVLNDSINFNIPVYDIAGLPEAIKVDYNITNLNDPTIRLSGSFNSPSLVIASHSLPSGQYRLEFKTPDDEQSVTTETIIWRQTDTSTPYPTSLWIPESNYYYSENEKTVDITFGSFWEGWVLMIVSDGDNILKKEWLSPQDTLWKKQIEIPDKSLTLFVSLTAMHNLKAETGQIKIESKKKLDKLNIESVSFRDNISAGEKEKWCFRFKIGEEIAPDVNVFAVMTDKALNSIYNFKWHFNIWQPSVYNKISLTIPRFFSNSSYTSYSGYKPQNKSRYGNPIPEWQTYGYPLVSYGPYFDSRVLYRNASVKAMKMESIADLTNYDDAVMEEATLETTMVTQGVGAVQSKQENVELRPVELPLAFFMPGLKTDINGMVNINFTVPNFNTTWQLQIAAYDDQLLNSVLVLDAVASKPVMVKSNLPQFLRTGDKAVVEAALFNNSEKEVPLKGYLEILELNTGKILAARDYSAEETAPGGNRIISIDFDVPDNASALIVKAYAYGNNHSDGEQGIIPVLPSSSPVMESKTFYAKSTDKVIEIAIPKINKDANVTLKYCDNPLWEVLLSLPGITETCSSSAISVSHWLFGTVLASDIISGNTEIKERLAKILSSEDSTLSMSNLQKDAYLKITALEATPWLNNAQTETERIRSLSKYFDSSAIQSQIDSKVSLLQKLQKSDGGWSWWEGMKSSPYITEEVLKILGYLNSKDLLLPDLKQPAKNAVKYYDSWLIELYEKNKKINVTSALNYFYTRDKLGLPYAGKIKKMKEETIDSILSQWRYWDIPEKARAAMVLLSEDKYRKSAEEIIESLKQFLDKRLPVAQEALLLELFEKESANSNALEKVVQTLLLQKETEDWGSDYNTIPVVYGLTCLSINKNINYRLPEIYIDNTLIPLPETQILTGYFTINLDATGLTGKKIVIKRDEGFPAWGGIISQYITPIKEVKSAKVENLSVEKKIFKEDASGQLKEVKTYSQGDKITMVINLNVGKDMDYVVIKDTRSACLQPIDNTSGYTFKDGLWAYREIGATQTSLFIENLPAGKYVLNYECHADRDGEYSLGITEVQCLYSPSQTAHSGGGIIKVMEATD